MKAETITAPFLASVNTASFCCSKNAASALWQIRGSFLSATSNSLFPTKSKTGFGKGLEGIEVEGIEVEGLEVEGIEVEGIDVEGVLFILVFII